MTITPTYAQALGNSLANKTFRTPGFLRWIPGVADHLAARRTIDGNVNRWTIATVNHPGTEAECRRELTMDFMDEISIFHNGIDTGNGGREVSVIVDGKKVVYSLSPEKVKAIQAEIRASGQDEVELLELQVQNKKSQLPKE